jgi:hypothetical protein
MADRSPPIANRGPEALQLLLLGDRDGAEQQLRLLTRSELQRLVKTAQVLAVMCQRVVRDTWPGSGTG